jgi:hypothetical protein
MCVSSFQCVERNCVTGTLNWTEWALCVSALFSLLREIVWLAHWTELNEHFLCQQCSVCWEKLCYWHTELNWISTFCVSSVQCVEGNFVTGTLNWTEWALCVSAVFSVLREIVWLAHWTELNEQFVCQQCSVCWEKLCDWHTEHNWMSTFCVSSVQWVERKFVTGTLNWTEWALCVSAVFSVLREIVWLAHWTEWALCVSAVFSLLGEIVWLAHWTETNGHFVCQQYSVC